MSNLKNTKEPQVDSFVTQLVKYQSLLWVLVVTAILVHGYMGRSWSAVQSFQINDNWCKVGVQGIGQHCFGDFGLPYYRGLGVSTYIQGNFAASNTPITAGIFELFRLFPYNISLFTYLILLVTSVMLPFLINLNLGTFSTRLQIATFSGLLTLGGISALDRGNHVAMVVPLLYFYVGAIRANKWKRAVVFLVLISLLKFWGIIFIVALIAKSRWREAISACLATFVISIATISLFPGSTSSSVRAMISMITNRDYSKSISGFSISISGLTKRINCALTTNSWCNTKLVKESFFNSTFFAVLVLLALSVLVLVLMRNKSVPHFVWMSVLISMGFLAVPDAPVYNLLLTATLIALLSNSSDIDSVFGWGRSKKALSVVLLITNTPLTLFSNVPSWLSSGTGEGPTVFRSDFWLIPTAWLVLLAVFVSDYIRNTKVQRI